MNLVRRLVDEDMEVVCFGRELSPHWPGQARAVLGDFHKAPDALLAELSGSTVFHLVSSSRPSPNTERAGLELEQNLGATLRILEASREGNCRWVFASSGGTVYGEAQTDRVAEDHPTNPISSYGVSKLATEKYLMLYKAIHGLDVTVARIANPYGPWQLGSKGQGLIATLLRKIAAGEPIDIWGDGEMVRDYVYIDDTVDALLTIARSAQSGSVYNVGSGIGTSINQLTAEISALLSADPVLRYAPPRGVDVRRNVLDITRITRDLGWAPKTSLAEGVSRTKNWLESHALVI